MQGLYQKINYPKQAVLNNVEGRVMLQFVVNSDGNVVDAKVIEGIGSGCNAEALRVISQAKFKPTTQNGIPVDIQLKIPIVFKLGD